MIPGPLPGRPPHSGPVLPREPHAAAPVRSSSLAPRWATAGEQTAPSSFGLVLAARRAQIGASSAPAATSSSVWQASLGLAAEAAWPTGFPQGGTALGATVVDIARRFIGDRYVWGGHAPGGFDCTGLTWYVYRQAGVDIPNHDLAGQLAAGQPVPRSQLQAGDLVFFENTYQPGLSHVGIALGDGRFLHAMSEQHGVTISSLDEPYWSQRYYGASRPGSMGGQL